MTRYLKLRWIRGSDKASGLQADSHTPVSDRDLPDAASLPDTVPVGSCTCKRCAEGVTTNLPEPIVDIRHDELSSDT